MKTRIELIAGLTSHNRVAAEVTRRIPPTTSTSLPRWLRWRGLAVAGLLFVASSALSPSAFAQPSSANSISFQGALTGAGGQPLPNANYDLTFKFYDVPTSGTALATSNVPNVPVAGGIASTPIPVDVSWFSGQTRYLGISINGAAELSPRVLITAVPYALSAQEVSQSTITKGPQLSQNRLLLGSEALGDSSLILQIDNPNMTNARAVLQGIHSAGNAFSDLYINPGGGNVYTGPGFVIGSDSPGASSVHINVTGTDTEIQAIRSQGSSYGMVIINKSGGKVGIGTDNVTKMLTVAGEAQVTVLTITSDRNAKTGFRNVDSRAILEKLVALPITTWGYTNNPTIRHIGPVAQDFAAAFAVGEDDKHVATVDADGVALAAIQGLHQLVEEKEAKIQNLEKRLEALEHKLETGFATTDRP